jgi:hypothetical protein
MYAVIRRYRVRLGTVASAAQVAETSLLPRMSQLPGFVAYYLLDAGDGVLASISVCSTSEGADAAAALAVEWFRSDWPSFQLIPPEMTDGEVLVHAEMGRAAGRRRVERRSVSDRRGPEERRLGPDRRRAPLSCAVERRSGERRVPLDRRAGLERRAGWQATQDTRPARRLAMAPSRRHASGIA